MEAHASFSLNQSVVFLILLPSVFTSIIVYMFFFFNDTATTEIYTLSLHDALPIFAWRFAPNWCIGLRPRLGPCLRPDRDRKSTRLNSSHSQISYAVFCLKKKKEPQEKPTTRQTRQSKSQTPQTREEMAAEVPDPGT